MVPELCRDPSDGQGQNRTRELIDRARNGDQRAFDELYRRYQIPLTRWAHGRLCPAARGQNETADLVHISIFKAFHSLEGFVYRHEGSFLGFLHEILRNEVVSINRRWIAKKPNLDVDGDEPDSGPGPLEQLEEKERLELYERALNALTIRERDLIRMREMGLKHSEIAEEGDFPTANAARMAVTRAVANLAEVLRGMMHERT